MANDVNITTNDGSIKIPASSDQHEALAQSLNNPDAFALFKSNPQSFLNEYGVEIDNGLSNRLSERAAGFETLSEFQNSLNDDGGEATAVAIAHGAFAAVHTKIAVVV